ncbi:MAG: hypothetical protein JWN84_2963 [Nocardioides sp.]|nr:hypothetical protein [Nocardioides sp.]
MATVTHVVRPQQRWRAIAREARRTTRRTLRQWRRDAPAWVLATAAAMPLPSAVRLWLSRVFLWRRRMQWVPLRSVLLGGQNGMTAAEFAKATDNLLWPSQRVVDGPHAALIRAAGLTELSDEQILRSSYGELARAGISTAGQYFGATDDASIVAQARQFLAWSAGDDAAQQATGRGSRRPLASAPGSPVLLAPIRDSDCYQVVDGHHRVAAWAASGAVGLKARIRRVPVTTPLQDVLDEMSWIGGERELYQPVQAPELDRSWRVVRRCTDRLERMTHLLASLGLPGDQGEKGGRVPSYLDVASCYGWFLSHMADLGFEVHGVERDELGSLLGATVYGLNPACVTTGDARTYLMTHDRRHDVVSCFSLLHHVLRDRGTDGGIEFVQLLDRSTRSVLFLDTGQAHEEWFRDTLGEWDDEHVRQFLLDNTTFDEVIDLGPDSDGVGHYAGNYGRHLFACVRWPR